MRAFQTLLVFVLLVKYEIQPTVADRPLRGVHFRIIPMEEAEIVILKRNENGSITFANGRAIEVIEWLSRSLGFTYHLIPPFKSPLTFGNGSSSRGAASYLHSDEADVIVGVVIMTSERYAEFDLIFPWTVSAYALLIPVIDPLANVEAAWKPFQNHIWILIIASIAIVPLCLHLFSVLLNRLSMLQNTVTDLFFSQYENSTEYVANVLLSQGGVCYPKKLTIRLVAGAWCLAAFVLVNSYSSTLISFLSASNNQPFIKSIYDIPEKPGAHLVIEQGRTVEVIFSAANSGIFKYVSDDLKRNPYLRCSKTQDCVKNVLSGSHVFTSAASLLKAFIDEDYRATGRCRMTLAKETFLNVLATFALQKSNPHTERFNYAMIQLWETGLLNKWRNMFLPRENPCVTNVKQNSPKVRLTMKNLGSVFVLLIIGLAGASIVFILEILTLLKKKN